MSDPLIWTVLITAVMLDCAANVALLAFTVARCRVLDRRYADEIQWRDERARIVDARAEQQVGKVVWRLPMPGAEKPLNNN